MNNKETIKIGVRLEECSKCTRYDYELSLYAKETMEQRKQIKVLEKALELAIKDMVIAIKMLKDDYVEHIESDMQLYKQQAKKELEND